MFKSTRIVESMDGGGVAAVVLEPPDEAWRMFRNRVDPIEIVDEVGHARVVERVADASDIELGEVKHWSRHGSVLCVTPPLPGPALGAGLRCSLRCVVAARAGRDGSGPAPARPRRRRTHRWCGPRSGL